MGLENPEEYHFPKQNNSNHSSDNNRNDNNESSSHYDISQSNDKEEINEALLIAIEILREEAALKIWNF